MRYLFLFIQVILLCSCSTLNRQKMLGGFIGASILGGVSANIGKELSPNKESERLNEMIGATSGGAVGFYAGSQIAESLWENDPDNRPLNPPFLHNDASTEETQRTVIKVLRPKNIQRIELETELPSFSKIKSKRPMSSPTNWTLMKKKQMMDEESTTNHTGPMSMFWSNEEF